MEEQILKQLTDWLTNEPMTDEIARKQVAKEITSHVFEFVAWIAADCVKLWNKADVYQDTETSKTFNGVEKLYQYWLINIKDK